MPRLRDRSIGLTISIGFAGTLLLMAVLVGLTLYQIEETREYRRVLTEETTPAIDQAEDMQASVLRLNDLLRINIFSNSPADVAALTDADTQLRADLDALARFAQPPAEQAEVEALRHHVAEFRDAAKEVLDRKAAFGPTVAEHHYRGNVLPHLRPITESAQRLQQVKQERVEAIRERLARRGDRLAVYLVIGFLVATFLCIAVARATIRMITVPARRLVVAARVLERGEYDRAIDLGAVATPESAEPVNEIERLRQSFVGMARALQEREDRLLQQARYLEATNSRLAALQSITDVALTHLELDDLMRELVERAVVATSARGGAVLLLDDGGRLRARATHAISPEAAEALYRDSNGGWGERLLGGSELMLPVPASSDGRAPDDLRGGGRIASLIALPLTAGRRVIGLVHLDSAQPGQFGEDALALMRVVAERVALAIERARAFAALEEWNETLARRVAEQQQQLVRSERLASIGLVGAGIAHELRNPLGVITNSVFFLRRRLRDADEKVARHTEIIEREVAHAVRIIESLVQFSQDTAPAAYPVALGEILEATLPRAEVPGSVTLEVDVPPDLPRVQADEQRLVQVLENLLRNAVQAMEGQGKIALAAESAGEEVTITVRDTGPGIAAEHRSHIFEPLFTTKAKGMGLGLALSKKMIEAWGGGIAVECPREGGTVFRICLRAAPPLPAVSPIHSSEAGS